MMDDSDRKFTHSRCKGSAKTALTSEECQTITRDRTVLNKPWKWLRELCTESEQDANEKPRFRIKCL
ncbi:hypothetical protein EBR78_02005 [bacterium]|nr:hypothetical protein [bacterium]NBX82856.1 hypothetical protein [bacterium]